jgi:hypothetical protein
MLNKKIGLIALLASCAIGKGVADTLTDYTAGAGDVLICFRNGGANDLVVDAGSISTFTNLTADQRYPITTYTGAQLAFVGTNGVSWSAFTWLSDNTLFVSKARTSLNTQTTPWLAQKSAAQAGVDGLMAKIPVGAAINVGFNNLNTPAAAGSDVSPKNNPVEVKGAVIHSTGDGNTDLLARA